MARPRQASAQSANAEKRIKSKSKSDLSRGAGDGGGGGGINWKSGKSPKSAKTVKIGCEDKEKGRCGIIKLKIVSLGESLFNQCNPTPLALFRIMFGFLMLLDIPQERGLEDADIRFGDPNFCFFPLFSWIQPVPVQFACVLYSIMWIGALGICVGFKFHLSCPLFLGPYLYFFLLDKSRWNNHSYLFALFAILLWVSGAGNHLSLDSIFLPHEEKAKGVPRWNYFLLKFQIFVLYFFAGIKKLDSDWISGYSMKNLSRHRIFDPIKVILTADVIEYYMVHIGGLFYDLCVGFMLNFEISKKLGVFLSIAFHGLNSQIFDIGMFPYVCLASLVLFSDPEGFPSKYFRRKRNKETLLYKQELNESENFPRGTSSLTHKQKRTCGLILIYIGLQTFMPFSHFITKGYNNWTPGLYGYSWDMMVNSWETLHQKITVRNRITGQEKYLDPDVWVVNDRWSSHADMAIQYAQCVERNLERFNISEIEIYFDIWKSLNGRFQQRIFDPRVDILRAPWSPFHSVSWVLPLLREYSHYRSSYFETVASDVANWTSSSDVIFVADFPGLYLENFLPKELINITLTLINGEVIVEQEGRENVTLSISTLSNWSSLSHQNLIPTSTSIDGGKFHKIHTISYPQAPASCYMYTYTNASQLRLEQNQQNQNQNAEVENKNIFANVVEDFTNFMWDKVEVFSRSVYLVSNAYLNLFFNVPMVVRKAVIPA